jgi:hypothetical protein
MAGDNSVSSATIFSPDQPGFAEWLRRGKCADSKPRYIGITYCETLLKQKRHLRLDSLKGNADAYRCVIHQAASFDPHYFSAFYPGKAAFFPCKRHCPRKIQLYDVAGVQGSHNRQPDKNACLAYVGASAVKKSVRLGQPYTHRPRHLSSYAITLFRYRIHT